MSNNSTEDIIGTLYDMVQDARSMPLAADKCILERDRVLDLLDEVISRLPAEIKQSRTIVESRNELIAQARREAEGILQKANEQASSLPYGHQRKLEIARAMALDPKLLLLDEPAAGMNAEESAELVSFVRQIRDRFDITILMIEHHMDVVSNLCDHVTVLNFGKTICVGTPEEVKSDPEVIRAYLGGE